jgi:hypothetical protein
MLTLSPIIARPPAPPTSPSRRGERVNQRKICKPPAVPAPGRHGQRGQDAVVLAGVTSMMPYDTYRLYQAERARSPREIQRAAQLASAVSGLFRAITQTARRPYPSAPDGASPQTAPAASRGTMAGAMEGS